ncbi:MAG: hypothetical protein JW866_03155 [Ignavibacteriales bacterium]|nr:hypothetical protein [Ignavibacteriales bacterium]
MKRLLVVILAFFLISCSSSDEAELSSQKSGPVGVKFEDLSFDEVLEKAQKLNKPILVDVWSFG